VIRYNDHISLLGLPDEAYQYALGDRVDRRGAILGPPRSLRGKRTLPAVRAVWDVGG
jgi:hypothetical protein